MARNSKSFESFCVHNRDYYSKRHYSRAVPTISATSVIPSLHKNSSIPSRISTPARGLAKLAVPISSAVAPAMRKSSAWLIPLNNDTNACTSSPLLHSTPPWERKHQVCDLFDDTSFKICLPAPKKDVPLS